MSSQPSLHSDPKLAEIVRELSKTGWAVALCDASWQLVWVSEDLKILLDETDEERLGYGKHLLECYLSEAWSKTVTPESQLRTFQDCAGLFMADMGSAELVEFMLRLGQQHGLSTDDMMPFAERMIDMEPRDSFVLASEFDYLQGDLPPFPVTLLTIRARDESGSLVGNVLLYSSALPASVLALVARGDPGMFSRMTRLIEPGRRRAAILFADLQLSSVLSRRLPSAAYFRLIRALTTAIDDVIIQHQGVVGKHAGDGVTAFFLEDDIGSSSGAVRAAILAARAISTASAIVAMEIGEEFGGLVAVEDCAVNVGVHWGGTLYMGQLVTGGRLEVTALGDEVNECARIQQSARDGQALASKTLIEHLSDDDAGALGIDPDTVTYQTVAELPSAGQKAVRDAGGIPVTVL